MEDAAPPSPLPPPPPSPLIPLSASPLILPQTMPPTSTSVAPMASVSTMIPPSDTDSTVPQPPILVPLAITTPLVPPPTIAALPIAAPPPPIVPIPALRPIPPPAIPKPPVSDKKEDSDGDGHDKATESPPSSPTHKDDAEYEISEETKKLKERQEQLLQQILMRRRAFALAVPTNDSAVRARLRSLNHPITLFGEREMERRERLRSIMAKLDADGELEKLLKAHEASEGAVDDGSARDEEQEMETIQRQPFYTEGSEALLKARIEIMKFSLPRAVSRIEKAKRKRDTADEDEDAEADLVLLQVSRFIMDSSEIGDDRPLSGCAFSPDATLLATCGWSGLTKVWSVPNMKKVATLKGHTERVTAVAFSPNGNNIATASADRTAILWDLNGNRLRNFDGHLARLARLAFHPSGAYLGTASFDKTWRLWDVNTGIELLLQEGHSRSVYGIAFQCDGALAATCGLDALARVWDMRTGRSLLALEGHVKPVLSVDFSPNGYLLATGSEDHTCRIWDLRKRCSIYTIPAHSSLISQVKYEPAEGYFLATASYDNTARIWSAGDFKMVKVLAGHEGKLMGIDVAPDAQCIATVSYDRTIKLWSDSG